MRARPPPCALYSAAKVGVLLIVQGTEVCISSGRATLEIVEYALPGVEEDVEVPRPATEPPKDDVSIVTPEDAAESSILKKSGAPAGKRRRVFDDRVNVVPLGPLPAQRPLGPAAHEVWFGCPKD